MELINLFRNSPQAHSRPPSCKATVSLSSSDGSARPHPFSALQNLANFMPLPSPFSWSPIRALSEGSLNEGKFDKDEKERKKAFVSKERQLARLRERMAADEGVVIQARVMQQQPAPVLPCRWCADRVVTP
jgi:hypothetical protein